MPVNKLLFDSIFGNFYLDTPDGSFSVPGMGVNFLDYWTPKLVEPAERAFKNLTLVLTDRCNMTCDYCWQSNNRLSLGDINSTTIDRWLDFFMNQGTNLPKKILYYGGEPLLRVDLIEYSTRKINMICERNNYPKPQQHIFTNGVLIRPPVVELFKRENIYPIISIDGNREITSSHRKTAQGRTLWEKVIAGIEFLKNENVPFGIACTISDLEFDVDAVAGYLVKIIHPNSIEFNLRHDHDMVEVYQGTPSPNFDNFCRAWDLALSQGVRVVDIHKRVKPLVDGIPLTNSSSACKNKLVVMPNGKVSSFNGAIAHKELQRDPDLPGWKENFIEVWERELRNKPACLTCKAIFICGQGSGFSSYIQYGDFNHTPVFHCEYCLAVINYIETRIYNQLSLEKETSPRLIKAEEIARSFSLRQ